jgi:hypothetical protein
MRTPTFPAIVALTLTAPLSAQITVDPMGPISFCGSPTLNVGFSTVGSFNPGNVFNMELSDATGSFASPAVIGSFTGTTSGAISCDFPAGIVGGSGVSIRVMASDPPETGTTYPLPITTVIPPNAGINASVTVCSSDAPIDLFALLGIAAQSGGAWTNPGGAPVSGLFDPSVDPVGCYTYVVAVDPPCANDVATVCVTVNQAPNAGLNASVTICSSASAFSLLTLLGGTPQIGGTWTYSGAPQSAFFNPATSTPGCYTYTVPGVSPCANASATVCVTVVAAPNAGIDGMITVCSEGPSVDLFAQLGGTAQPGGTWSGALAATNGVYDPTTMDPGVYQYDVAAMGCINDVATVNVVEVIAANAGGNASLGVCSSDSPFLLFDFLLGTLQAGGSWLDPYLVPTSGTFTPANSTPGCYQYVVQGMAPCVNDSAVVCVSVQASANAGTGAAVNWCQSFGNIDLFAQLGGAPDTGGIWTDDDATGALTGASFAAGTVPPGTYSFTYNVGTAPCSPASSTVSVTVGPCLLPPETGLPAE